MNYHRNGIEKLERGEGGTKRDRKRRGERNLKKGKREERKEKRIEGREKKRVTAVLIPFVTPARKLLKMKSYHNAAERYANCNT